MTAKVIKTEPDYEEALEALGHLMDRNAEPETPEAAQLELLALLIQDYESKQFRINPPDPIEAIRFRMEQQNLSARDLIP